MCKFLATGNSVFTLCSSIQHGMHMYFSQCTAVSEYAVETTAQDSNTVQDKAKCHVSIEATLQSINRLFIGFNTVT